MSFKSSSTKHHRIVPTWITAITIRRSSSSNKVFVKYWQKPNNLLSHVIIYSRVFLDHLSNAIINVIVWVLNSSQGFPNEQQSSNIKQMNNTNNRYLTTIWQIDVFTNLLLAISVDIYSNIESSQNKHSTTISTTFWVNCSLEIHKLTIVLQVNIDEQSHTLHQNQTV